jgi:GH15 family glucan-1,4-alpha-glucosidase
LNWDYRYSWLRDSSLVLDALMTLDHHDEAGDFMHWLEQTVGHDVGRHPQIVYGIGGERQLDEHTLDHLDGYRQSKPVRVGNAAYKQRQEDIYGEVLRAAVLHYEHQRPADTAWRILRALAEDAAQRWHEPGRGLWEVRGRPEQFVYSKAMCWAALDAAARLAERYGLQGRVDHWRSVAKDIQHTVLERGFNSEVGAFTQSFGSSRLDAAALMLPRIGIISASDSRMRSTVKQIRRHLMRDGLVYRYPVQDGQGHEGTFMLCTFWLVDVLTRQGQVEEAREIFEGALRRANDLDLLAEETDPDSGAQLGNFPQAFTHAGLISAAVSLASANR